MMTAKIESPPTEFQICIENPNICISKNKRSKFAINYQKITINLDHFVFRDAK
jgi:hypothetical protein